MNRSRTSDRLQEAGLATAGHARLPASAGLPVRLVEAALRNPAAAGGSLVSGLAFLTIIVNALSNQPMRHPSPLFHTREMPAMTQSALAPARQAEPVAAPAPIVVPTTTIAVDPAPAPVQHSPSETASIQPLPPLAAPPRQRTAEPTPTAAAPAASQLVARVQQALKDRGLYSGTVDGISGPATAEAIRTFEKSQGLSPTGEAGERLLAALRAERARQQVAARPQTAAIPVAAPVPSEPLTGSVEARMQKIQRALNSAGYGQVRTDGHFDEKTSEAIRRYEAEHGMPITGMLSDRLVLDLLVRNAQLR